MMLAPLPGQSKKKPSPASERIEGEGFMSLYAQKKAGA